MILKIKKFEDIGFTMYNFYSIIICYIFNFELYNLYSICCCWSWGILLSFHSILYFDSKAFNKMTSKLQIKTVTFHTGNFILHIVPCYITCIYRPKYIEVYHGLISSFIHLLWIYVISNKTWSLDNVYIKQSQKVWNKLYIISSLTEIIVPYIFK